MRRNCDDLVVRLAAVEHLQNAERAAIDLTAGKRRLVDADDDVERVVILMQRARDEAVVAGIMHRRKQNAVEAELSADLVELVLVAAASRNFDYCSDHFRRVRADWKVVPWVHDRDPFHGSLVIHRLFLDAEIFCSERRDPIEIVFRQIRQVARRGKLGELLLVVNVRQRADDTRLGEQPLERGLSERHLRP